MKKIKLFTLALAALFAGNVMAAEYLLDGNTSYSIPYTFEGSSVTIKADSRFEVEQKQMWNDKSVKSYGIKLANSANDNMDTAYIEISSLDELISGLELSASTNSTGAGKKYGVLYCSVAPFDKNYVISGEAQTSISKDLADASQVFSVPAGTMSIRIYRKVNYDKTPYGEGSSVYIYNYKITTTPAPKDDATLKSITIDGEALEGFDPATETYNVELPFGTTTVPTVAAVAASKKATAVVTPATAIPGATTILVTAEDATTTKTYTINFTAAQTASSEKELLNVTVGGKAVAISENAGSLLVSKSADLTALVINFEVSESATASIESGSAQDFTNPLSIVVTAQDNSTATYTITVTKAVKDVLYLTAASTEGDKMYAVVAAKGFYVDARKNGTNTDFSGYDLVVLHESLTGKDAASGELSALATANVPVLNTKSYFYPEGRWGWGAAANGNDQQGVKVNTAKYTNIASHPLFAGLSDTITIYNTAVAKNIQPITSFVEGKEGYVLANVAGGAAIHELPAAARVGAEGTAKYLLISLLNGQYADLTAEAETLLSNAVDYLMSAEAWVPQSGPSTAVDNAVVAEKAQKMIINGQLVIVKDGVRYNAQGVQL